MVILLREDTARRGHDNALEFLGEMVIMDLTAEQERESAQILRTAGFTAAWILDSEDQSEIVFLVPKDEGDFSSLSESPTVHAVVLALMKVLPGLKVWVSDDKRGIPKTRMY